MVDVKQIGRIRFIDARSNERTKLTVTTWGDSVQLDVDPAGEERVRIHLNDETSRILGKQLGKASDVVRKEKK